MYLQGLGGHHPLCQPVQSPAAGEDHQLAEMRTGHLFLPVLCWAMDSCIFPHRILKEMWANQCTKMWTGIKICSMKILVKIHIWLLRTCNEGETTQRCLDFYVGYKLLNKRRPFYLYSSCNLKSSSRVIRNKWSDWNEKEESLFPYSGAVKHSL